MRQPELFHGLLRATKSCHASVSGSATEILSGLLGDISGMSAIFPDCCVVLERHAMIGILPCAVLSCLQIASVVYRYQYGAGHGVSSNPELDSRAVQEVCAAAVSALAESMHGGEVGEHIAEAVVRLACAAAEREPETCTSSSQQVLPCVCDGFTQSCPAGGGRGSFLGRMLCDCLAAPSNILMSLVGALLFQCPVFCMSAPCPFLILRSDGSAGLSPSRGSPAMPSAALQEHMRDSY